MLNCAARVWLIYFPGVKKGGMPGKKRVFRIAFIKATIFQRPDDVNIVSHKSKSPG